MNKWKTSLEEAVKRSFSKDPQEQSCVKGLKDRFLFCCLNCCTCESCSCTVDVNFENKLV